MESKLQTFSAFQIYSTGISEKISVMVDRLWIKDNRVFFRVVECMTPNEETFRKERLNNVYSISRKDFVSIRCRLYF
ncbi:MAG: hypothetical protein KAT57_01200 [Candidatus Lokiarchaeota archaeon]|nr:hypothetical protein [Candidatus Lokiarchaeota archaeon]